MTASQPIRTTAPDAGPFSAGLRKLFSIVLCCLIVVACLRLWVLPIFASFWLDESLIIWTIRDGFAQIVPRAFISLQSIPFCMLEWVASRVGGVHELSLRLPSLAAGVATLFVLYRIGLETIDREFGLILAAIYAATPAIVVEIPTVRPYAIAMLAETGALLWLLRWFRGGGTRGSAFLWALCAAIAACFHYLFLLPFLIESVLFLFICTTGRRRNPDQIVICGLTAAVLLIPLLPQFLVFVRQRQLLSSVPPPTWFALATALVPFSLLLATAVAGLAQWAAGQRLLWSPPKKKYYVPAAGAILLLVPVAAFFLVSRLTSVRLFTPNYLLISAPAGILLWGWFIQSVGPFPIRQIAILLSLSINTVCMGVETVVPRYRTDDWRSAVRAIPSSGRLLVYSSLVETRRLDWLQKPDRIGYFTAPLSVYRDISGREMSIVPFEFDAASRGYMSTTVSGLILRQEPITLVARLSAPGAGRYWVEWLCEQLRNAGFRRIQELEFGEISVSVFDSPDRIH